MIDTNFRGYSTVKATVLNGICRYHCFEYGPPDKYEEWSSLNWY